MNNLINRIIAGAADYEDGTMGQDRCIECYCRDHNLEIYVEQAQAEAFKQGALMAGIPLSVIEGRTKLRDHFSFEYIKSQTGKR